MTILNFQIYSDGGTIELATNKGIFCFDNRLFSTTKFQLYNGYPNSDNGNIINNSQDLN